MRQLQLLIKGGFLGEEIRGNTPNGLKDRELYETSQRICGPFIMVINKFSSEGSLFPCYDPNQFSPVSWM